MKIQNVRTTLKKVHAIRNPQFSRWLITLLYNLTPAFRRRVISGGFPRKKSTSYEAGNMVILVVKQTVKWKLGRHDRCKNN